MMASSTRSPPKWSYLYNDEKEVYEYHKRCCDEGDVSCCAKAKWIPVAGAYDFRISVYSSDTAAALKCMVRICEPEKTFWLSGVEGVFRGMFVREDAIFGVNIGDRELDEQTTFALRCISKLVKDGSVYIDEHMNWKVEDDDCCTKVLTRDVYDALILKYKKEIALTVELGFTHNVLPLVRDIIKDKLYPEWIEPLEVAVDESEPYMEIGEDVSERTREFLAHVDVPAPAEDP